MGTFAKGDKVKFKGYTSLAADQEAILTEGEEVIITTVVDDENYQVQSVASGKKDTIWDTEMEALPVEAAAEAAAPAAKPRIRKAAAPAAAAQTAAPAAEAAAPAKGKKAAKAAKAAPAAAAGDTEPPAATNPAKAAKPAKAPKAAKPKKAPPVEEELKILPASDYAASVQKVTKTDASALKAAKALMGKIGSDFWTLGGVLSFIRRHKSYKGIIKEGQTEPAYDGNKGFAEYVEQELGLKYRKAMYYIDIHEKFGPLGVEEDKILAVEWTKLRELAPVVTKKNVNKWLARASEANRDTLQAEIKEELVKINSGQTTETAPPEVTVKRTGFKFLLFQAQGTVARDAIDKAKEILGGEADDNAAFAHITAEWLSLAETPKK